MKKNIGSALALYPTPVVVVGTMVDSKVNWVLAAHIGILGHDRIMVSLFNAHFSNKGIKETGKLSVNIVVEDMLQRADYVGCVSGAKTDKSGVFEFTSSEAGVPLIDESPLTMECEVVDNYQTESFDNFICKINATYVKEEYLTEKDKVDYTKLKPVLFEMPTYSYLRTGDVIAKCTSLGKELKNK